MIFLGGLDPACGP